MSASARPRPEGWADLARPLRSDRSTDAVIVGAGPAGLTAALLATRKGLQVTVVEASDRVGGLAASTTVGGQRVDLGSHRLHPAASPTSRRLLEELLGDDLQVRERHGRMRLPDGWTPFPLRAGQLLRDLPLRRSAAIGRDLLAGPLRREAPDDSYADVVRARLGPTVHRSFHGPYAEKLWGRSPDVLAGELARRRIALRGGGDVLARLRRTSSPAGRTFLYPRHGYGQIVVRLADAAVDAGADLQLASRPLAVQESGGAVEVEWTDDGGRVHRMSAGRVLWTAPPGPLAEVTGQPVPSLDHRGVALVYLVLDQDRYLEWDAHYVPDPAVPFVRLSEPKNYRDGDDPAGTTVLCAEVPCSRDDDVWGADDDDLAGRVVEGMGRLGLPPVTPVEIAVIRLPAVYPLLLQADVGRVRQELATLEELRGVTLLGRQGLGVADNLHHVMDMADAAVSCLGRDGAWDGGRWRRARRAFDDHVVED